MRLHEVANQVHGLAVNGVINGEVFSERRLENQLKAMLRKDNDQYIFEIMLPDGNWFAKVIRRGNMYDYYIPDTREEEQRLITELIVGGKHFVGEIVMHKGHECRVTKVWNDDGRNGISIVPTGGYGFEIDIYDEQL